jgi:Ca-activated chloride channel family protein
MRSLHQSNRRALAWAAALAGTCFFLCGFAPRLSAQAHPSSAPNSGNSQPVAHPPEKSAQPAADPDATAMQGDASSTFRINVKLVNIFTTVVDKNGAPIATLKEEDFQIFEDGVPQRIAFFQRESGLPLSIVIAIDTSLSTKADQRLELDAARKFVRTILRPIDAVALFEFSEIVDQLTPFTSDLRVLDKGIAKVRTGAATALYDTLYLGSEALIPRRGRKVMVVITDGGDTMSKVSYQEAVREAQEAEVILYSIIVVPIESNAGRDIGGEHALIQLSRDTGGKYFYASGLQQLDSAFQQISDELRTQYLFAYYPIPRLSSSEFRKIDVKIAPNTTNYPNAAELQARHRSGYYTMPSK